MHALCMKLLHAYYGTIAVVIYKYTRCSINVIVDLMSP